MALITIEHLAKTYVSGSVETRAVRDVSFTIESGEFVAIMGPSGSGKSTFLHMLGLLETPTSGTYQFMGVDAARYSEKQAAEIRNARIGFVFQAFNFLPRTSALENVMLPLLYSQVKEDVWRTLAEKALGVVGLSERMHYACSELSGGEKQRVAIARALVNNPDVIFADEPTGNLDSLTGTMIMESIASLNRDQGHTIILITHDMAIARYASRIITLCDGVILNDQKK